MTTGASPGYIAASIPEDEAARLADLSAYAILDTPPEEAFDDLTALASSIAGTPIALISLVDGGRQWFKSRIGFPAAETPREVSFCAHAILGDDTLVVPDATKDPRFAGNPNVLNDPSIRFYAGTPLTTPGGRKLGTLCVIDRVPRTLSEKEEEALRIIGRQVITQLELRKAGIELRTRGEQLRVLSRMKDEFVSVVSHELRTPLTSIKGSLQLLVEDAVDEAADRDRLQRVALSNAERLIRLVNDMLDISKIEAGGLKLRKLPIEPRELADAAVRSVAQMAESANVTLHFRVEDGLAPISVDADRTVQAIVNLLSNAVKFSPAGSSVEMSVGLEGNDLVVAVRDSGPGIPPELMGHLFQKFSQLDTADGRRVAGTGLGLAISKGIVEQHGGRITVRSSPGEGSTFSVHLPR